MKKRIRRFTAHWLSYEESCQKEWNKICQDAMSCGTEIEEIFIDTLSEDEVLKCEISYIPSIEFATLNENNESERKCLVSGSFTYDNIRNFYRKYFTE